MSTLDELVPKQKLRVMDLLREAGVDVSHWKDYKGKNPATNPKYCYNWSFEQPGEKVVVCLWHPSLREEKGRIVFSRKMEPDRVGPGETNWKHRETEFSTRLELAYRQQLPVNVIVLKGERYDLDRGHTQASKVHARLLDPVPWAVTKYNYGSGECLLVRGEYPVTPAVDASDFELAWFEGEARRQFIYHRRREGAARREKIKQAKSANDGRLICEVPGCHFDFVERYGSLGQDYAHAHHLRPLRDAPKEGRKTNLVDLAIVCPNCHAMIHIGGKCRALNELITSI